MPSVFQIRHLARVVHIMWTRFASSSGSSFYIGNFVLALAVALLVVAVVRVNEFRDRGFGPLKLRVLIALHLLGSMLFAIGLALFGIDFDGRELVIVGWFVGLGLGLLFPTQIYLGLVRRIQLRDRT